MEEDVGMSSVCNDSQCMECLYNAKGTSGCGQVSDKVKGS